MAKQFRDFESARNYVRDLKLKNRIAWTKYCKSGNKPNDIPTDPAGYYKKEFRGIGDFLGNGTTRNYLPFTESHKFARELNLKGQREWQAYCKSGNKPTNIPSHPDGTYKNRGWQNWGNWLGTGRVSDNNKSYLPFAEARKFVRSLGLKNQKEWLAYCKSGNKPNDIPMKVERTYKKDFNGIGDWLGTGTIASQNKEYLSAKEAKPVLKKLFKEYGIKNLKGWSKFAKTHAKLLDELNLPSDILTIYSKERFEMRKK